MTIRAPNRYLPRQTGRARELRQRQTRAEATLWAALRQADPYRLGFRRQHPIGPYVVDFCAPRVGLIVELDGIGHQEPFQTEYDAERTGYLEALSYRVIRFTNRQVLDDPVAIVEVLREEMDSLPSTPQPPSPWEGEGGAGRPGEVLAQNCPTPTDAQ